MAIDGVNTAMTTVQFARARSLARTVETAESSSSQVGTGGRAGRVVVAVPASAGAATRADRMVAAATFHFTYRPVVGKLAAKRLAQGADSNYWSMAVNRLA